MLTIRGEQFEALGSYMLGRFYQETRAYLRDRFPEQISELSSNELNELIQNAMERAESYEFRTNMEIRGFLRIMLTQVDNSFENADWFVDVLGNTSLNSRGKMSALLEQLDLQTTSTNTEGLAYGGPPTSQEG